MPGNLLPHSAVRVVSRFTAKLTKRKFAFHHSGRRVVALITAVVGILGELVLLNLLPTLSIAFCPGTSTEHGVLDKPARSCEPEH